MKKRIRNIFSLVICIVCINPQNMLGAAYESTSELGSLSDDSLEIEENCDLGLFFKTIEAEKDFETPGLLWAHYLIQAARYGDLDRVKALINMQDNWGITALHETASYGKCEETRALLVLGADVDIQDKSGRTALHRALANGHIGVLPIVVRNQMQDHYGRSALHEAAMNGYTAIVICLLQLAVSVNVQDDEGNTPLLLAARNAHSGIVELLLQFRADKNKRNHMGYTALDVALSEFETQKIYMAEVGDSSSNDIFNSIPRLTDLAIIIDLLKE